MLSYSIIVCGNNERWGKWDEPPKGDRALLDFDESLLAVATMRRAKRQHSLCVCLISFKTESAPPMCCWLLVGDLSSDLLSLRRRASHSLVKMTRLASPHFLLLYSCRLGGGEICFCSLIGSQQNRTNCHSSWDLFVNWGLIVVITWLGSIS